MLSNHCSILLIDDDADVLDAYTQLLEQAGYQVSACNIAVVATIGFFASLISIGRTIHIQSEGHKVAEFLISSVFYPVVIGILLSALATLQSI